MSPIQNRNGKAKLRRKKIYLDISQMIERIEILWKGGFELKITEKRTNDNPKEWLQYI